MKIRLTLFFIILPAAFVLWAFAVQKTKTAESLGWKLAYQSYTFKNFTFEEGLQKANKLGLKYVEAYRGQKLSSTNPNPTHYDSDDATKNEMKHLLKQHQVKLINYGVVKGQDEEEWKRIFDFAKEMGVETLTAEPEPSQFDYLERMCDEYEINIAIHNHPKPSRYWEPDSILKYVEGRSHRIGACADVGHWVRSGLDPVESLKKLKGRIISIHFKDLNEKTRQAHDVPWGTGVCDVPAILQELKNQKFKGVFSIEYEHNWDNNVPEIAQSIKYFNKTLSNLN
jgi:sugar phosphate isomerase/epimerase